jgi:hypothetical protein
MLYKPLPATFGALVELLAIRLASLHIIEEAQVDEVLVIRNLESYLVCATASRRHPSASSLPFGRACRHEAAAM